MVFGEKFFVGTAIAIFGNVSRDISFLGDSRSIFFIFHIIKELPNKNTVYDRPYTSNFMSYTTQVVDTTPLLSVALPT